MLNPNSVKWVGCTFLLFFSLMEIQLTPFDLSTKYIFILKHGLKCREAHFKHIHLTIQTFFLTILRRKIKSEMLDMNSEFRLFSQFCVDPSQFRLSFSGLQDTNWDLQDINLQFWVYILQLFFFSEFWVYIQQDSIKISLARDL